MPAGFLLHSRPYRETSSLLIFFTAEEGRVDVVAKAARGNARRKSGKPLLFAAYDVTWFGERELRTMQYCEAVSPVFHLEGVSLYCGLYVNELLYRLLPKHVQETGLFHAYEQVLSCLSSGIDHEACLRRFEMSLLDSLGYGISLSMDVTGMPVEPEAVYQFMPEQGLNRVQSGGQSFHVMGPGGDFLSIHEGDFNRDSVRKLAKKLMRSALSPYLGDKPLNSRLFFSHMPS